MRTEPVDVIAPARSLSAESSGRRPYGWMAIAFGGFVVGVVYLFWPAFSSRFASLPGTLGDFRFVNLVVEHWYRVLLGHESWREMSFFHPQPGVLGYSDALFLHAVPYVVFRLGRISPYYAYFWTLVTILAVGYAGTLWLFRRILNVVWPIAIAAAMIFAFSNIIVLKIIHANLYAVAFVPIALGLAWRLVAAIDAGKPFARPGVMLAVLVPMLLYTSYYIGWFTVFLFCLWTVVLVAQQYLCASRRLRGFLARAWRARLPLAGLAVVFTVALVPFVATYYQPYLDYGPRAWSEVLTMLPVPADLINVGWGNWMWTSLTSSVIPKGRPMGHELTVGFPPGLLGLYAIMLVVFGTRVARAGAGYDRAVAMRDQALLCLGIAVVIAWVLMFKFGDASAWYPVFKLFPGASAIRAVFRLQMLLHLAALMLVAVGLDHLWRARHRRAVVAALMAFLMVEQFNVFRVAYDARADTAWLANLQPPPSACRYFVVAPQGAPRNRKPVDVQIEAMAVAARFNLPTLNGYSSLVPHGWDARLADVHDPGYASVALDWMRSHRLRDGLCLLDLRAGTWWIPQADNRDLRRVNLVRQEFTSFEDGLTLDLRGFHSLETVGRWTNGNAAIVPARPIPGSRVLISGQVLDPRGSRIRIAIDGTTMLDRKLDVGPFRFEFPDEGSVGLIEIASTAFVPKLLGVNADTRQLGVVIDAASVE